jgi:hypothetical protein
MVKSTAQYSGSIIMPPLFSILLFFLFSGRIENSWAQAHLAVRPDSQCLGHGDGSTTTSCSSSATVRFNIEDPNSPGGWSSSFEKDPQGRCVLGTTPFEWILRRPSLTGQLSPGRRPTRMASSTTSITDMGMPNRHAE